MTSNSVHAARMREAAQEATDAWRKFSARQLEITQQVRADVLAQPERFEHVKTPRQLRALAGSVINKDATIAGTLAVFDRQNTATTAAATARLVEQSDRIIEQNDRITHLLEQLLKTAR